MDAKTIKKQYLKNAVRPPLRAFLRLSACASLCAFLCTTSQIAAAQADNPPSEAAARELAEAKGNFASPDMYWAPHTFWFWNGGFARDNILAEAADFCRERLNPGYVHVRAWPIYNGVWLSDKWFELFGAALEETQKNGMYMTYTIGGPCLSIGSFDKESPLHARSLDWRIIDAKEDTPLPECFFAVAATRNSDGKITSLRKIDDAKIRAGESAFLFDIYKDVSSQYKNTYLDKRFFDAWKKFEHDKYEKRFSKHFGKTMRSVFVDQEGDWGYKIAWSEDLAETFKKRAGYDIALALPLLIEEDADGKFMKARCDWFDAVSQCYTECFAEPMAKWCAERGMKMTCHYWEGDLYQQAMMVGDFLRIQRASQIPGTDALFYTVLNRPELLTETASVAAFEGRENMCEYPGVAGWNLTPATLKDMGNSAVALGVTQHVIHGINTDRTLEHVSYPPDFYLYNPSWRTFHLWCDFIRRAVHVGRLGRPDASTLIFCPIESVWALTGGGVFDKKNPVEMGYITIDIIGAENPRADEIREIDRVYQTAQRNMFFARVGFLNADSHYINQMSAESGKLKYKDFSFDTIVIPETWIMRLATAKKILDFAKSGGRVVSIGRLPNASFERGANDTEMEKIFTEISASKNFVKRAPENVAEMLEPAARFDKPADKVIALRKIIGAKTFLWIANNSEKPFSATMSAPAPGAAKKWNCETGEISPLLQNPDGSIRLEMAPHEAFWISFNPSEEPQRNSADSAEREILDISKDWTILLDHEKQIYTNRSMNPINDELTRGLKMPRLAAWDEIGMPHFSGTLDYVKEVEIPRPTGREILKIENVRHTARVFVNSKLAGERMWAPFEFEIGKFLKSGTNEIRIEVSNTLLNELTSYESYGYKNRNRALPKATKSELKSGAFGKAAIFERLP